MSARSPARPVALAALALCLVGGLAAAARPQADKALHPPPDHGPRVLVITGANNHDWQSTSRELATLLGEARGLAGDHPFEVTVTEQPAVDLADAEALAGYDAFVLDYNGPRWGEAAEAAFLEAVSGGVGVVVVHAANNAFPGWEDYERLVARMWRQGTGHGRYHAFDVLAVDREHPLTRGLPGLRAHPDELYHRLVPMHEVEVRVLMDAFSDPLTGGTGEREPMLMVGSFGRGRVAHTPLGHVWTGVEETKATYDDPQLQRLLVNATEWAATGRVTAGRRRAARTTEWEQHAGWVDLFDGWSLDGWTRTRGPAHSPHSAPGPGAGWSVVDGCLRLAPGGRGGDLVSAETYDDFELEVEWLATPGANSGIKYRVPPLEPGQHPRGPEFQILDDARHKDGRNELTSAGALYGIVPPEHDHEWAPGIYHTARIVARGQRLEHWLDGERLLVAHVGDETWTAAHAASKFADLPRYGLDGGHVVLQDHGDEVWFRSVRIRRLGRGEEPGTDAGLDMSAELNGWHALGDAVYTGDGTSILGEVGGGAQSFLVSDREFGDFVLEVDVRNEGPGNSGIQVRSQVDPKTRILSGYQIEIDPSDRAWSGGLYDESRRFWMDDLSGDDEAAVRARSAFRPGEWNRYRIECVGPSLKAWVNGVPTADALDGMSLRGVLGLQVHSGKDCEVRWRGLRLRELPGESRWAEVATDVPLTERDDLEFALSGANPSLRFGHEGPGALVIELLPWGRPDVNSEPVFPPIGGSVPGLLEFRHDGSIHVTVEAGEQPQLVELHLHGTRLVLRRDGALLTDVALPEDLPRLEQMQVRLGGRGRLRRFDQLVVR